MKRKLEGLVSEIEWKSYALPDVYLKGYIEEEFIPKLKDLLKYLQNSEKGIK